MVLLDVWENDMSEKAVLCVGDQKIELPVIVGAEGEKAVDISSASRRHGTDDLRPVAVEHGGLCKSRDHHV